MEVNLEPAEFHVGGTRAALAFGNPESVPLETCAPGRWVRPVSDNGLDFGTVTFTGPFGSVELPFDPLFESYDIDLPLADFIPGATYSFQASGGPDAGPFSADVVAPRDFSFVSLSSPAAITPGMEFSLAWSGSDGDPVITLLDIVDPQTAEILEGYACRFADDGAAAIPASVTAALDPAAGHTIVFMRESTKDLEIPELGPGFVFSSWERVVSATVSK